MAKNPKKEQPNPKPVKKPKKGGVTTNDDVPTGTIPPNPPPNPPHGH